MGGQEEFLEQGSSLAVVKTLGITRVIKDKRLQNIPRRGSGRLVEDSPPKTHSRQSS